MTLQINKPVLLLLTACMLTVTVLAQNNQTRFPCDSAIIVSEKQFDSIVSFSAHLLQTKKLSALTADQHRAIIRADNTIWIGETRIARYKTGNYAVIRKFLGDRNYLTNMLKLYPEWSPNRGMGIFFHQLNIEYGGTPCRWSMYTITK